MENMFEFKNIIESISKKELTPREGLDMLRHRNGVHPSSSMVLPSAAVNFYDYQWHETSVVATDNLPGKAVIVSVAGGEGNRWYMSDSDIFINVYAEFCSSHCNQQQSLDYYRRIVSGLYHGNNNPSIIRFVFS